MMISETKYLLIPISYDRKIIARKGKFVNKTEKTNNSVSIVYIGNIVREQKEKEGRKKSIGLNEPGVKNKKDGEMCAGQAVVKIKSRF